ncbi:telomere-binding protein 1 isoform X2 [Brachypodium distachyon]|uniref:Uncharacterized protein n=1 Tax=Brachypodium distachyon TaxID=15368 RepID=A0A0Q3MAL4_BRADI|nr:telomere-binding protein 1 isoform X2 [Brachypodium distachyon]KQK01366.1 hypothetical protein BRADI_3g55430v3 [Brachypodium distachyon]KQK01369.1 hypothetical protein BRADI_3g55430v3 [Brachypodium distachyon]|eukprot:XP_024316500.1 telomere-binding protein 1 isoform X2 [Brachypodium distachyon]
MVFRKMPGRGSCGRGRGRGRGSGQVRATPCATTLAPVKRSARLKKKQMYALDLLATVAETLSSDQEGSSSGTDTDGAVASYNSNGTSVKSEQFDEVPPFNSTALGQNCCEEYTVSCAGTCASLRQTNICKMESLLTQNVADTVSESLTEKSDVFVKGSPVSCTKPRRLDCGLGTIPEYGTIGVCPRCPTRSVEVKQEDGDRPEVIKSQVDGSAATLHSSVDTMDLDIKPPFVISSESTSGVHLDVHEKGHNSSPFCFSKVQHAAGDCRTRRLFATRIRKAARNKICGKMSNKGSKLNFRGKKISTARRRVQMHRTMLKTKKVAEFYSAQPSDEETLTETSGTSFSMGGQDPPCASEGCHVKFVIKSFNIPELLIEVPENATVGSLKRIVRDAVTKTIEGSLRVSVLLQGQIIQDDNKTLHQAGICHGAKLDSMGFTLECEAERGSHPSAIPPEEMEPVGVSDVKPLSTVKWEEPSPSCSLSNPGDYPFEGTVQDTSESSQAIGTAPTLNVTELAIVPFSKSKQRDFGQRRKRRPFSVAEVELLVEAVEQLGFGRWKDVKFHAFGSNNERTYVDCKDKWKNLVHTASIPLQLRRGQAIPPQELLDRVLAAQTYWSVQQPKPEPR